MTARRAALLVALYLGAGASLAALGLVGPLARGQSGAVDFTTFDPDPLVLPPTGGVVVLRAEAMTSAPSVVVTLALESPDGREVRTSARHTLTPRSPGVVFGDLELALPSNGPTGWWTVRVKEAFEAAGDGQRQVPVTGQTSVLVLVHPDQPVAGLETMPWPQPRGDASHSGRTLSIGPRSIDVVRWTFQASDRQPFHTPVVAADGTLYALTWGGELYALDAEGRERWQRPFPFTSRVAFPPALDAAGDIIVAADTGTLFAVRPDRTLAWSTPLAETPGGARPLSQPVVDDEGRIFVVRAPWTLEVFGPDGGRIASTALPPPDGGLPEVPFTPSPIEGPPLALVPHGPALVVSADGLAVVQADGELVAQVPCGCAPRGVSTVPDGDLALVSAGSEVVAVSIGARERVWSTSDQDPTRFAGTVWAPPTVAWAKGVGKLVYIVSEDGWLRMFTLDGSLVLARNLQLPGRAQPVIDADGNIYFADACRTVRSWAPLASPRWIFEIDATGCNGLASGIALTRSGSLVWPGPDGTLRVLGTNRLPVPGFTATWDHDAFLFDASSSYDPDGTPLTYAWDLGEGASARGVSIRHRFATSGAHQVKLTVSDGASTVSTTQEVVVNFPPIASVVDETVGERVRLNASSSRDPEGEPLSYNWTLDGEPAGTGPVLTIVGEPPRVYDVTLVVGDGTRTAQERLRALAPAPSQWRAVTVALYDGACPNGICAFPANLAFTEGDLVEALVVNGASRTVDVSTGLPSVPGGGSTATLGPGQQATLHVLADEPGAFNLDASVAGSAAAPTRVPIAVNHAPTALTWHVEAPVETVHVDRSTTVLFFIVGPAPPADVAVRFALRSGLDEIASRRVSLPADQPINETVPVTFTPNERGPLSVTASAQSTDTDLVALRPRSGTAATFTLDVQAPTMLQRVSDAVSGAGPLALLVGAIIVASGSLVAARAVRARRSAAGKGGTAGSSGGRPANGDQTIAASLRPRKVDRFEIERVLGEGAFGTTYLATDTVLERRIVLKELEHTGHADAHALLLHEARAAANLSHPNVVVVHDVVEDGGRLLLVMEFVEGGTLAELVQEGPLEVKEALNVLTDILHGLAALHEAGIVHRDLKPSNILITPDGVAKITDFGVAARANGEAALEGDTFVGTPRYMAPEQLEGKRPGAQADLYAAGAILYEMVTAEHHLGVAAGSAPEPADLLRLRSKLPAPGVGKGMNQVLSRALERDPAKRFQSAHEFLAVLRKGPG